MTVILITVALCAGLGVSLFALRSGWRDPKNWKIDPVRGKLTFNHWKEIILHAVVSVMLLALLIFWIS